MNKPRYLPNPDRLSVLAAVMALAYLSTRFIQFPGREFAVQLPGLYLTLTLNIQTAVGLLAAGLTATGASWLLRDHPDFNAIRSRQHWILPALYAWVIQFSLSQLEFGVQWWLGLAAGCTLIILILVAEYIAFDPDDVRFPLAATGLNAAAFVLFLVFATVLRAANVRLYVILPALALAGGLASLRALYLRLHGDWDLITAGIIALLIGQFGAALHYWPLAPLTFGLVMLAPAFALTGLIGGLAEGRTLRQAIVEPGLALILILGIAWWTR